MSETFTLKPPACEPPLEPGFRPAVLANHNFLENARSSGASVPLVLGFERTHGQVSRYETEVFDETHPDSPANLVYAEKLAKFLLWQHGAYRIYVGGPSSVGKHLRKMFSPEGTLAFDAEFMGNTVYGESFQVVTCRPEDVPAAEESTNPLGRHLDGFRVGFDLGASDVKVSAVADGISIYSEEIVWEPGKYDDPVRHYDTILSALKQAASKLPRVDAVGGSAAGVYVDNSPRVASLFRAVPEERFNEVRTLFYRLRDEFHVPFQVVNDGNVSALAGSMALEDNEVLGVALGSSEAAGYVGSDGSMTDWLNELAFAPIDYSPTGDIDEWSGYRGCGARYLSQQCVFRLAEKAEIELPQDATNAEKLKAVQERLEAGHEGALDIWRSMSFFLGYALAHYADFYDLRHVLLLGRCTSGSGGDILLDGAREVFASEFPELGEQINIQLPDEATRRVGQSIAAASLPAL